MFNCILGHIKSIWDSMKQFNAFWGPLWSLLKTFCRKWDPMRPCIEDKAREGHTLAWSLHDPPSFVGLFSLQPMQPPCPRTGAHMPRNYRKAKLGLKKRSMATIWIHTLPFPNLFERRLLGLDLNGVEGRSRGIALEASQRRNHDHDAFIGFLVGGVIGARQTSSPSSLVEG